MIFFNAYLPLLITLMCPVTTDIDSLFCQWNKASIRSLEHSYDKAVNKNEKHLYKNRLEAVQVFWDIQEDSLNRASIRWKYLQKINSDFDLKNTRWTVIEVTKSGEIVQLTNYLAYYDKQKKARLVEYEYRKGDWEKVFEKKEEIKINDINLKKSRTEFGTGYNNDVVVSDFNSYSVLGSEYFLVSTLSFESKIYALINTKKSED